MAMLQTMLLFCSMVITTSDVNPSRDNTISKDSSATGNVPGSFVSSHTSWVYKDNFDGEYDDNLDFSAETSSSYDSECIIFECSSESDDTESDEFFKFIPLETNETNDE